MEGAKRDFSKEIISAIEDSRQQIIQNNISCSTAIIDIESAFYNSQMTALKMMFDSQMTADDLHRKEMDLSNKMDDYIHIGEFLLTLGIGTLAVGIAFPDKLIELMGLGLIFLGGLAYIIIIAKLRPMIEKNKKEKSEIIKKHNESMSSNKEQFQKILEEIKGRS